ncbi:MAG: DUF1415 domain-containing protein [Deltaproteobacteria bacterium]|nr:DUF1415 domain-containing protein [Deltaproteobacteria bacterium]
MDPTAIERAARGLLDRYLVEIVERFELCPWARPARERGELHVEILVAPAHQAADVVAAIARIVDDPRASLGMVVFAASAMTNRELVELRDAGMRRDVAIAHFHPDGQGDLVTPARLVPCLRRSPDPMLQVVRWSALEAARRVPPPPDRATQLQWLAGQGAPPPPSIVDAIEAANHRTISAVGLEGFEAAIAELARARAIAYGM